MVFVFRFLLCCLLFLILHASAEEIRISSAQLRQGLQNGEFQALIDVRSVGEWNSGHIENATLLANLNEFGISSTAASPDEIAGCKTCSIAVYCQSGNRAGSAIRLLEENGFTGPLYNGLGMGQWEEAGFPSVTGPSVNPPCKSSGTCDCSVGEAADCLVDENDSPSSFPSSIPSSLPSSAPSPGSPPTLQPVPERKEEQPTPFRCRGVGRGNEDSGGEGGRVSRQKDGCVRQRLLRGEDAV